MGIPFMNHELIMRGGSMKKHMLMVIVFQLFFSLFVLYPHNIFADDPAKKQVSSEKSVTGLITKKEACPVAESPQTPCPEIETSTIKSDIKEYVITLQNLADRYKIILKPSTVIKAGDKNLLPEQLLPEQHFITVTYNETGEKMSIASVILEKVKAPKRIKFWSMLIGLLLTSILFLLLSGFLKKTVGISGLIVGFDKRYSNSKFQMVIWTFLAIFSYVTLYFERVLASTMTQFVYSSSINIPENLGILMGISAGSFLGAKAITSSKVEAGSISKDQANKPSFLDLITNDYKAIDLGDAQMFAWTLVAAGIYLINFIRMWSYLDPSPEVSLPNVDSTLLVLTGVSQAAYAGKKLLTSDARPTITSIEPKDGAKAGNRIIINGTAFGNQQGVIILDKNTNLTIVSWYDAAILAEIPAGTASEKTVLCVQTAFKQIVTCSYNILKEGE